MNLYVRYFDHETLACNMDDVKAFLATLHDVKVNDDMIQRVAEFAQSDNAYPFRLKVSYSNYILFLKTEAKDMAEFKYLEKLHKEQRFENRMSMAEKKRNQLQMLSEPKPGWYESKIMFKRVVMSPETGKCQYVDTLFRARLKAESPMDCYNRMIEHLKNRQDVDPRSQYPSVKSPNFEYKFIEPNDAPAQSAEAPAAED